MKKKLDQVQMFLEKYKLDGWLLYDFKGSNDIFYTFLEIDPKHVGTRRFFYWIERGCIEPVKIVSKVEKHFLDNIPGKTICYSSWQEMHSILKDVLKKSYDVAMEFSKHSEIPTASKVDAGMIDFLRSLGKNIKSSAPFLIYFTSVLDESQKEKHFEAAKFLDNLSKKTFDWIFQNYQNQITEYDVQQYILKEIYDNGYITKDEGIDPPICAINQNTADPHYNATKDNSQILKKGDFILIDLWCKKANDPRSVFGDITRVAVLDVKPSKKQIEIFNIVRGAQRAAFDLVKNRFDEDREILGYEVDLAARNFVEKSGMEKYFVHRTGHNIETQLHGRGTNMDDLESHDVRPLVPNTCFSIEPGVYIPGEFGIRQESDVFIDEDKKVHLTGGYQNEIFCILA